MSSEEAVLRYLDAHQDRLVEISRAIWERPELGLLETFASALLADELRSAGFSIEMGVGQMPTAFVASWGEGKPIIGMLGEYDALPSLSQKVSATRDPIEEGAPGHGCGHNLLGVGAMGAALAVKEAMETGNLPGTIRFYGCPAEETLAGKVFMARDGVFDDLDAALSWHPADVNAVSTTLSSSLNSFKVNFHGVASHAGSAPEAGRSALDGVQLMDVGVNYMREHVIKDARIHCVITDGGQVPNVVPPYAQVWYYVRAPKREQVEQIYSWMRDIAKGASLMTGTTHDIDFLTGCYNELPNDVMGDLLLEKMRRVGAPKFTDEEKVLARDLQKTYSAASIEKVLAEFRTTREEIGDLLCEAILEPRSKGQVRGGSTDVGDVAHITPTAQIRVCCQALGTSPHSWQKTVASGMGIGFKGMMFAARVLGLAALELETRPALLQAAREEFERSTGGKKYVSPLPEGAIPRPAG